MTKYCDSKKLERNWFEWIVASSVPILEPYRSDGLLWTKIVGHVNGDDQIHDAELDPTHPRRLHCIALERRVRLRSENGMTRWFRKQPFRTSLREQMIRFGLPTEDNEDLIRRGYYRERPTVSSWQDVLEDIGLMCQGIAMNFNQDSEGARHDLAQEALLQVISKLRRGKLVYIPGKAPVFNLLTTTIHRCMYSILSRDTRQRQNLRSLLDKAANGYLPEHQRGHILGRYRQRCRN